MKKQIHFILFSCLLGSALMLSNIQNAGAQTMTIAPHMIVINSSGPDVQCLYGGPLIGSITDFNIKLYFNGVEVANAYAFTYCYIDNVFKAEFDRQSITFNTAGVFEAKMIGTYNTIDANGNTNAFYIDKWDWVEIKVPGKNGK